MSEQIIESHDRSELEQTAPLPDLKKVYISLHKSYCRQMDDRFREGKNFNVMTMPRGTHLNGRDIGGGRINPHYMSESKFNPNEMTATYYMAPGQSLEIKLNMPDGTYEKVDVEKLKEAIDEQKQTYREQIREREQQKETENQKSRIHSAEKKTDTEID